MFAVFLVDLNARVTVFKKTATVFLTWGPSKGRKTRKEVREESNEPEPLPSQTQPN